MSHGSRPPPPSSSPPQYRLPSMHHGEQDDSASMGVEDSLQGHTGFPSSTNLFARPPIPQGQSSYAFATTPDALPQGWYSRDARLSETPEAGPSLAPAFNLPPRLERPVGRAPPLNFSTTMTRPGGVNLFSLPVTGASAGAGSALGTSFDDASSSMSQSFSFAPRNGSGGMGGAMLSMPPPAPQQPLPQTRREPLPPSAAPHTPIRPARATTATTALFADPTSVTPANLDMAALAAERRIRQQRAAASRSSTEQMLSGLAPRRSVSFSTTATTPVNHGAGSVTPDNMPNMARMVPAPPNRAAAIAAPTRTTAIDTGMSHLGRAPRPPPHGYRDLSISTSSSSTTDTSMLTRPTATRLFHTSHPTAHSTWTTYPPQRPSSAALHASEAQEQSTTASSSLYTFDPSSSSSSSSHSVERKMPTVRLRKWDGSQLSVPAYLVAAAESGESAVEEVFELDTVDRFDVRALVGGYGESVLGRRDVSKVGRGGEAGRGIKSKAEEGEEEGGDGAGEDVDALKAILEIQLGLKGLHGWYGHTYHNPKPCRPSRPATASNEVQHTDGRTSRKRRRRGSSTSSTGSSPPPPPPPSTSPVLHTKRDQQAEEPTKSTPEEEEEEEEEDNESTPIIVYDTFGRVRGTITLPNYTLRGGPSFPLPNPRETFALRYASASHTILSHASAIGSKEDQLCAEVELVKARWEALQSGASFSSSSSSSKLKKDQNTGENVEGQKKSTIRSDRFYTELKSKQKALKTFRCSYRNGLLKGLQNALVDSTLFYSVRSTSC